MNGDCPAYYHRDTALLDVDAADRLILLEGQTFDAARQNQVILWRIDPELHRKESLGTFTLDEEAGEVLHWKSWCVEGNTLYMEANLCNRRVALLVGNLKNGESGAFLPPVNGEKTIKFVGIEGGRIYWKEGDNSLWSVSYTHLDVYKRQDEGFGGRRLFESTEGIGASLYQCAACAVSQ